MIITCSCLHCDGRISFDKSEFYPTRSDATRKYGPLVICPHCNYKTEVYLPIRFWWIASAVSILTFIALCLWLNYDALANKLALAFRAALDFLLISIAGLLYFVPTIIGRRKRNAVAIGVLNLFLGWTFVGWVVATVWACTHEAPLDEASRVPRKPVPKLLPALLILISLTLAVISFRFESMSSKERELDDQWRKWDEVYNLHSKNADLALGMNKILIDGNRETGRFDRESFNSFRNIGSSALENMKESRERMRAISIESGKIREFRKYMRYTFRTLAVFAGAAFFLLYKRSKPQCPPI